MASPDKIRERIAEIALRRKNVTLDEIEWVVNQLEQFHSVASRPARHGTLFRVQDQKFMVNSHSPGSKQVKGYSVDDFVDAMIELGWYEEP